MSQPLKAVVVLFMFMQRYLRACSGRK